MARVLGIGPRCMLRPSWVWFCLTILGFVASFDADKAWSERLFFRSYGAAEGLTDLAGVCMAQVGSGYLLVCSEHGVFAYDGRVFRNLGVAQGLRDGGIVDDLALTSDGRLAVRYPDQLYVSEQAATLERPPSSLTFRAVDPHGMLFFNDHVRQLASTSEGLVLIAGRRAVRVEAAIGARPFLAPFAYDARERTELEGPTALFSVRGKLWETFGDGRVCSADPGYVRCFGPRQGLLSGPWNDIVEGAGGTILARSSGFLATVDPMSGSVTEEALPDQGGPYRSWDMMLGLFHTPAGELVTQSADGLIVRKRSGGWVALNAQDGVPAGIVASVVNDSSGQLWVQVYGRGLFRGLGYGHWEGLQENDGLSAGIPWQAVRTAGGSLWVSTDSGIDEVRQVGDAMRVVRVIPGPSFGLALSPNGNLWGTAGPVGGRVIDPDTGVAVAIPMPEADAVGLGVHGRVWFGTERGLYSVDDRTGRAPVAVRDGTWGHPVIGVLSDGSDGVWLLTDGKLWHRHADGRWVMVGGQWPSPDFQPRVMATAPDGRLWIGGAGGLYNLLLSGDRIVAAESFPQSGIGTSAVLAVTVDRRGWVWVGTGQGVFVFDGRRWIAVNSDIGMVWNDVSQGGIYDDPDGSVWIATSQGLSHLLDPSVLFAEHPVRIVISEATLGGTVLPARMLGYNTGPLSLQFGTFSYASERSIVFRYRMSGVDAAWAESSTGSVRYASVPPGRHVLTVIGYDALSHAVSDPVTLTVDMAFPWWRSPAAEVLYVLAFAGMLFGFVKLRERASVLKQHQLERLVEERTREMRLAQAELRRQVTLDGLTGLLNRTEVQRRLAERLTIGTAVDMLVAMIDIDYFKQINDRHGHLVGDDVLRAMGVRVSAALRDGEYAGRYGGEEMLVVLDDRDGLSADRILGLHQSVRGAPFHCGRTSITVTCSIGVAWAGPGDDWQSLVGRADAALYEAKTSGRDRVVESGDDQALSPSAWPSVAALRRGQAD